MKMTVNDAIIKMIKECAGSQYDIGHYIKVWSYANAGEQEKYRKAVPKFHDNVFKTKTGLELLESMYAAE